MVVVDPAVARMATSPGPVPVAGPLESSLRKVRVARTRLDFHSVVLVESVVALARPSAVPEGSRVAGVAAVVALQADLVALEVTAWSW